MSKEETWVVLARVEDEKSLFDSKDRIKSDDYERMVKSYDPAFRMAPVISGFSKEAGVAGPSHWVGEDLEPLGHISELDFDGFNLWGKVSELKDGNVGRVSKYVSNGFWQRSIGFWRNLPEKDGEPYLRHVALLGGEQPGIPNMPLLTEFFQDELQPAVGLENARIIANAEYEVRGIMNQPEDSDMDRDELRSEIGSVVATAMKDAISALRDELKQEHKVQETAPEQDTLRSEIRDLKDAVTLLAEAHKGTVQEKRELQIESQLESLVRAGRITPAEAASEQKFLPKLSEEDVAERIADLNQRSPILASRLSDVQVPDTEDLPINMRNFSIPNRAGDVAGYSVDQESFELLKEATRRAEGDPKKLREAAYALAGEICPEAN